MANSRGLGRGLGSLFGQSEEEFDNAVAELQGNKSGVNLLPMNNAAKRPPAASTQLAPSADAAAAVGEEGAPLNIPIRDIDANSEQPRKSFDETALNELCQSIKNHGVIQPIVVNKMGSRFMIIAGERRWRAAKLCGLDKIPAIVKNYSVKEVKEISLIENLQREDLNAVEAADAIKQLMKEFNLTQEEVADRIGKSRPNIANTLRLLELCPEVRAMVAENRLSAGHARSLVVIKERAAQIRLAEAACDNQMTVRDIEKAVKEILNPPPPTARPPLSIELKELAAKMQRLFATKINIFGNDDKGKIFVEYYSRDDIDRITEIIEQSIARGK
jgi:ParB family chromosome partitioning protein